MSDESVDERIDWVLLARFLAGEVTPSERRDFEEAVAADAAMTEEVELLRRRWDEAGALPDSTRIETMWMAITRITLDTGE